MDVRRKMNWLVFFSVFLAPVVLTIATVLFISRKADAAPGVAVIVGGICGIICGGMLGRWLGKSQGTQWLLGLFLAGVFAVVCVLMSCFGCLASGYQLKFQ